MNTGRSTTALSKRSNFGFKLNHIFPDARAGVDLLFIFFSYTRHAFQFELIFSHYSLQTTQFQTSQWPIDLNTSVHCNQCVLSSIKPPSLYVIPLKTGISSVWSILLLTSGVSSL